MCKPSKDSRASEEADAVSPLCIMELARSRRFGTHSLVTSN